jgi:hypothetical protein
MPFFLSDYRNSARSEAGMFESMKRSGFGLFGFISNYLFLLSLCAILVYIPASLGF